MLTFIYKKIVFFIRPQIEPVVIILERVMWALIMVVYLINSLVLLVQQNQTRYIMQKMEFERFGRLELMFHLVDKAIMLQCQGLEQGHKHLD